MKTIVLSMLIVASLVACKPQTPPSFDLVNAKKEIEAANKAIAEMFSKGDAAGIAAAYSKDGSAMFQYMPSVKGTENLNKAWADVIATTGGIELATLEVWGDQNYITEEGVFTLKSKDGTQVEKGKYLVLWKKEDGKWKLHRDMSNTDLPLPKQ
jgi:ketosteroid isomerase-like protein